MASPDTWTFPPPRTLLMLALENPATRLLIQVNLWLMGPNLLSQDSVDVSLPVVLAVCVAGESIENDDAGLDKLIATSQDLYTFKKRFACLVSLVQFIVAEVKKTFLKSVLNAQSLNNGDFYWRQKSSSLIVVQYNTTSRPIIIHLQIYIA